MPSWATANRAEDDSLAVLGHELRTPLTTIVAGVRVLREIGSPETRIARVRDAIERQADQLTRLVDDLPDVKRIVTALLSLNSYGREEVLDYQRAEDATLTRRCHPSPSTVQQGTLTFSQRLVGPCSYTLASSLATRPSNPRSTTCRHASWSSDASRRTGNTSPPAGRSRLIDSPAWSDCPDG